ncbi:MAG: hypothetical protein PHC58_06740 [Candidatus Omnitrophica bacterium]|nr:hypothetical protein [Candidatus Omnitrophota bacterium]
MLWLIFIIFVIFVGYISIYIFCNIKSNFKLTAEILNSEVEKHFLKYAVKGFYKNRKVTFDFFMGSPPSIVVKIIPCIEAKKQKGKMFAFSKPTRDTYFSGKIIQYKGPWTTRFEKTWQKNDIVSILEELTQSAEIVESEMK